MCLYALLQMADVVTHELSEEKNQEEPPLEHGPDDHGSPAEFSDAILSSESQAAGADMAERTPQEASREAGGLEDIGSVPADSDRSPGEEILYQEEHQTEDEGVVCVRVRTWRGT